MKKVAEYLSIFGAGGIVYALLEIVFRGYTHWSMIIVGGLAVLAVYLISAMNMSSWRKWILGAVVILTIEFIAGILINMVLGWRVWDYSAHRFHLYGQICLQFAFYWLLLCIPGNAICVLVRKKIFNHNGMN